MININAVPYPTGEYATAIEIMLPGDLPLESCSRSNRQDDGHYGRVLVDNLIEVVPINQHGDPITYKPLRDQFRPLVVTHDDLVAAGQQLGISWGPAEGEDEARVIKLAFIIKAGELLQQDLATWIPAAQAALEAPTQ